MNIFCLYISLILAVTTAQKNAGQLPPPPPPGLCLDPRMMSAVCTINTEIGSRMEQAHLQCAAAAQVQERRKKKTNKKNKGKGGKKGKRCDVDLDTLDPRLSEGLSDTSSGKKEEEKQQEEQR